MKLNEILHVGITVSNLERSRKFYSEILGLKDVGYLEMEGKNAENLFVRKGAMAHVAYLVGAPNTPPVELIEFVDKKSTVDKMDIFKTSISELCFHTDDIDKFYNHLLDNNVEVFSPPQEFDYTEYGFGKSKAMYFRDPDGIILEVVENL